jgi:hypothetical protein
MDEIDNRKSPAGGFHGTYMQELEMGMMAVVEI